MNKFDFHFGYISGFLGCGLSFVAFAAGFITGAYFWYKCADDTVASRDTKKELIKTCCGECNCEEHEEEDS